jgi:hypothetical protein
VDKEVNTLLRENKQIPVRELRAPREHPGAPRPAMNTFAARRPRASHTEVNVRSLQRGIVLMTILEPCRGINPFVFQGVAKSPEE